MENGVKESIGGGSQRDFIIEFLQSQRDNLVALNL